MVARIPNEPADYMDVQTLWNDRRDPHANPLSRDPRRSIPRPPNAKASGLTKMLSFLYSSKPTEEPPDIGAELR